MSTNRDHLRGCGAVAELEAMLRDFYGMRCALCMSSATSALEGLALALSLKNSEFVTTPLTYGASIGPWLMFGNRPAFADIDRTLTIDPFTAEAAITSRTKALLSVDLFGMPADDAALRGVADRHGLWFIADAAQSFGAFRNDRPASSLADALVLSFTAGKPLDALEGGAVLTNNLELYEKLVWFTQHPERQRRELRGHAWNEFGINGRMHPMAARLARRRFHQSIGEVARRRQAASEFLTAMAETGLVEPVECAENVLPSFFRVATLVRPSVEPAGLQVALRAAGWSCDARLSPLGLLHHRPFGGAERRRRSGINCRLAEACVPRLVEISSWTALAPQTTSTPEPRSSCDWVPGGRLESGPEVVGSTDGFL